MTLYYRLNGGSWVGLSNTITQTLHARLSDWITDEESTTQQVGTGTMAVGLSTEDYYAGENLDLDLGANEECEIEFSLNTYAPNVEHGDEIELQVWTYESGVGPWTACATYTNTPTIIVQKNVSYQSALVVGGGTPSDNQSAYMEGRAISETPAFLWGGYDVGGNTRYAIHANIPDVIWPRLPAFCYGAADIRFDVVGFGASGSAITQDITGDLNDYDGKVAFFMGHGAETNDTETADQRAFFGFTNGTAQYVFRSYIEDEDTYSSYNTDGAVHSSSCAGMYYSSGGTAGFDSWITNGVRIDWSTASDKIYECAALLMGEPAGSSYLQSYIGSWTNPDSETDDTVEVTGVGFKPDLVIMLNNLNISNGGGAGWTVGAASRVDNDAVSQGVLNTAFGSGYFNYPGYHNNQTRIMAHGIGSGVERWKITEWTDDGFNLECDAGNGINDDTGYYIALKFGYPMSAKMVLHSTATSTGNIDTVTQNRPKAVMAFYMDPGWSSGYPVNCSPHGVGFFDAATEVAGSARIGWLGSAWIGKSYTHDAKALFLYNYAGTKVMEATLSSFWGGGYTLNYTAATGSNACIAISFGTSYDVKSSQGAYMFAHSLYQPAHVHGWEHTKSSQHAYFNVVDAYDNLPAYLDGDPDPTVRSDTGAYMKGTDTIVIAIANTMTATSVGTQDITTTELNGLTPKAAIITVYGLQHNAAEPGNWKQSTGYTDGVYTVCVATGNANDSWTPYSLIHSKHRGPAATTNLALVQYPASGLLSGKAEFDSWITNGIRIDWTAATSAHYISVTFFAGSDLDADVGIMSLAAETTTATTDPGWKPDLILFPGQLYTDETLSTVTTGWYNKQVLGWTARDTENHSAYREINAGDGYYGFQAWVWCYWVYTLYSNWFTETPTSDPGAPYTNNAWFIYSWDTNGFTIDNEAAAQTIAYFALRFGASVRKRAAITGEIVLRDTDTGTLDYEIIPQEGANDYSLDLIDYMYFSGGMARSYTPWSFDGKSGMETQNFYGSVMESHITPANMSTVSLANWGYYYDCYSQYFDQKSNMYYTKDFPIRYYYVLHDGYNEMEDPYRDTTYYLGWCLSKESFIRNGIRMKWENSNWHEDALDTSHCIALAIGTPVWHDSTSAYMKGQILNWPGRTPRGCYLEGQVLGVWDDQDAYLKGQAVVTSDNSAYTFGQELVTDQQPAFMNTDADDLDNQPVYIEGYEANKSSKAAHLHGQDLASAQQSAYMVAEDYASGNNEAYLLAFDSANDNNEAFLWGKETVDTSQAAFLRGPNASSTPVYTAGSWDVLDATPAVTHGSIDVDDSKTAYLYGRIFVSDDTTAYTSGISTAAESTHAYMSAHVNSNLSAYLGGLIVTIDYVMLTNSDLSLSKKFRVLSEGYSHGQLIKGSQVNRTVGGGTDLQPSAIYRVWEPVIKVKETEVLAGYGDLGDLETFYGYNDPGGTPSNVLTFRNHYQEEFQVITVGLLQKMVVTQKVEGENAIYFIRLMLMEKK